MKTGAPMGIMHGNAVHSFEVVEWVRDLHEYHQLGPRSIRQLLPCINYNTLLDWIYYRTRTHA